MTTTHTRRARTTTRPSQTPPVPPTSDPGHGRGPNGGHGQNQRAWSGRALVLTTIPVAATITVHPPAGLLILAALCCWVIAATLETPAQ